MYFGFIEVSSNKVQEALLEVEINGVLRGVNIYQLALEGYFALGSYHFMDALRVWNEGREYVYSFPVPAQFVLKKED